MPYRTEDEAYDDWRDSPEGEEERRRNFWTGEQWERFGSARCVDCATPIFAMHQVRCHSCMERKAA